MSTIRKSGRARTAAAAAACLVGASAGLIGTATPAAALATGSATYTCDGGFTANTTWYRSPTGKLRIATNVASPVMLAPGDLSTVVGGVTLTNLDNLDPVIVLAASPSAPVNLPPTVLPVHYGGWIGPADIMCQLVPWSTYGTWPI